MKYPRNGQVPESMFSFCKDIKFLEQLVNSGFKSAYFIAIADDPLFYSGNNNGIYGLFRNQEPISGYYKAEWKPIINNTKYCLIKIMS